MIAVFTAEAALKNEAASLNALFELGLPLLHFRKPQLSEKQCQNILEAIHPSYYSRIMLHQFHDLAVIYRCKGIHLKGAHKKEFSATRDGLKTYIESYKSKGFQVSTGVHHLQELQDYQSLPLDYVFLSPIFDSVSKKGYKALKFDLEAFQNTPSNFPVWALGGITLEKLESVQQMGFKGAGVLGAIWKSNNPERYLEKILSKV